MDSSSSRGHSLDSDGGGANGPYTSGPNYQSWFGLETLRQLLYCWAEELSFYHHFFSFGLFSKNKISFYISSRVETVLTQVTELSFHLTHIVKIVVGPVTEHEPFDYLLMCCIKTPHVLCKGNKPFAFFILCRCSYHITIHGVLTQPRDWGTQRI